MTSRGPLNLAVVNGRVWARPGLTAVAIAGDRISTVGAGELGAARVIDAGGAWIIPAFNDAHVHFLTASRSLGELDLFGVEAQADVERRVADYATGHDGGWVLGRGWFYSAFPGGMPTVELLDRLVPDRPAYLESFDAHTGWANSRALALAGVATRDVLKEAAVLDVTRAIPPRTREQDLDALREGMRLAASRGIGSVQEAGDGQNQVELWEALRDAGELTLRVRLAFDLTPGLDVHGYGPPRPGDAWISTGILKAFADGVVELDAVGPALGRGRAALRRQLRGDGPRPSSVVDPSGRLVPASRRCCRASPTGARAGRATLSPSGKDGSSSPARRASSAPRRGPRAARTR